MWAALGEGLGSTVERAFARSSPWTVSLQAQARVLASATSTGLAPRSRVALPLPGGAAGVCDAPRQSCACTVLLWVRVGCRGRAVPSPRQPQRPTWDKLCWFQTRCPGSLAAVAPPVPWAPDALPFCPQTAGRAPPGPLRAPSLCNRQRWGGQRGRGAAGQAGSAGCACVRAGREGAKGPLVLSRCCSPE